MYNGIEEEFCSIAIKESSDLIDKIKEHPFNPSYGLENR